MPNGSRCPIGRGAQWVEGHNEKSDFIGSHSARHCVPGKPRSVGAELHTARIGINVMEWWGKRENDFPKKIKEKGGANHEGSG